MVISNLLEQERRVLESIDFSLKGMSTAISPSKKKKVIYASSPITSGKRMYDAFNDHECVSLQELKALDENIFKEDVMGPNLQAGAEFGDRLREIDEVGLVIAPGVFFGKGWTQQHYMSLWKQVIKRYADVICLNENYQYSNGCLEELLLGCVFGKELRDHEYNIIKPKGELPKIEKAIEWIDGSGADVTNLFNSYREFKLHLGI